MKRQKAAGGWRWTGAILLDGGEAAGHFSAIVARANLDGANERHDFIFIAEFGDERDRSTAAASPASGTHLYWASPKGQRDRPGGAEADLKPPAKSN